MNQFSKKYNPSQFYKRFLKWRSDHITNYRFVLLLSIFIGVSAGIMAFLLRSSVHYMRKYLQEDTLWDNNFFLIILPILGITLTVIYKKFFIKEDINYSITDILHAISKRKSRISSHKSHTSIIGSTLTAGFGGSIGLESPVIMSGAAIGSSLGRWFKLSYREITLLLACGSSGAIAAVFNTPIAAIVFALEVLMLDLSRFALIPLLIASISGAITAHILFPTELVLTFPSVEDYSSLDLVFFLVLGILAGLVSYYFSKVYMYIEKRFLQMKRQRIKILIGGIILGSLLFIFPSLYGEGYTAIKEILGGNISSHFENSLFGFISNHWLVVLSFIIFLILCKVIATSLTINSGGIGGIFAPSIFTGALLGFAFAFLYNQFGFGNELSPINFALVGMASMLGGVLHAPLTGIFLIAEITQGYQLFLPLMIATTISFITVKALISDSIFTIQLSKRGELITHNKDKAIMNFISLENILETNFSTINQNAKLKDLVKVISKTQRNIIAVVNDKYELQGAIHLNDVREIMFQQKLYNTVKVSDLMIAPSAIIKFNDSMQKIMDKFQKTDAWNLPVLKEEKYVGFISKSNMFNEYRKQLLNLSED